MNNLSKITDVINEKFKKQSTYTQEIVKNFRRIRGKVDWKVIHIMWIMWKKRWEYVFVCKNTGK